MTKTKPNYIRWFRDIAVDDVPLVGGKNASLGEMYRELTPQGVRVSNGFATTADAYRDMLTAAGLWDDLHTLLDGVDKRNVQELARRAHQAREIVYGAGLSHILRNEIL